MLQSDISISKFLVKYLYINKQETALVKQVLGVDEDLWTIVYTHLSSITDGIIFHYFVCHKITTFYWFS